MVLPGTEEGDVGNRGCGMRSSTDPGDLIPKSFEFDPIVSTSGQERLRCKRVCERGGERGGWGAGT